MGDRPHGARISGQGGLFVRATSGCRRTVGEDPVPFGRNPTRAQAAAAISEGAPDALQGLERIVIQALSRDDNQAPAIALKCLTSFDVLQPIGTHIGMVSAVVLDDELEFGIAKIESLRPVAIQFTKDVVDLGSGSPANTMSIRSRDSLGESTPARTYAAARRASRAPLPR